MYKATYPNVGLPASCPTSIGDLLLQEADPADTDLDPADLGGSAPVSTKNQSSFW